MPSKKAFGSMHELGKQNFQSIFWLRAERTVVFCDADWPTPLADRVGGQYSQYKRIRTGNKLKKLEDALVEQMLTVNWMSWVNFMNWVNWVNG